MRKSPSKTSHNRSLGERGEQLVAEWYESQGCRIVERNWRCREGEIDLIVHADREIVFCEVKTRTSNAFGSPAEAVTFAKQKRIIGLARQYLRTLDIYYPEIRFDVAEVIGKEINVIVGAF